MAKRPPKRPMQVEFDTLEDYEESYLQWIEEFERYDYERERCTEKEERFEDD